MGASMSSIHTGRIRWSEDIFVVDLAGRTIYGKVPVPPFDVCKSDGSFGRSFKVSSQVTKSAEQFVFSKTQPHSPQSAHC